MTERHALPMRRRCETFEIDFGGLNKVHTVTVGYYDDGRPGEVFINGGRSGEQVEAIARDGAVLVSMALQHGVSLDTIKHAITRDGQDAPQSIIGVVVDRLADGS
jgi:ribonucleoside-diphosphate reductase alpha chain